MEQTTETQDRSYAQQLVDEYYGNYEKVKPSEAELPNILSIIEFMLDKFYYPNGINLEPIKDDFEVENLSDTIGGRVGAVVSENMAVIKQGFYVKAKIQSKEDLKCIFVTDHLVHLGDLPISEIEHAITDEIQRRIKEREDDKYEILAIEKIILALDNPPEM